MKTLLKKGLQSVAVLGMAAALLAPTAAKAETTLMSYGVDLVTDYVSKGADQFTSVYKLNETDHSAVNVTPAIQPYFTLFGGNGFSVGIWTSFAVVNRDDDSEKDFTGLSSLDEVDYTFAYDWSNKLGSFTAALGFYTAFAKAESGGFDEGREYILKWGIPGMDSISPYITWIQSPTAGASIVRLGAGGGDSLTWSVYLDEKPAYGVQDITGTIGYGLGGGMSVSASVAFRPTPELVGYDSEGKYINFEGDEKDYPPAIAWLTFSYSGSVTE